MSRNAQRFNRNAQQAKQPKAKFEEQRQQGGESKLGYHSIALTQKQKQLGQMIRKNDLVFVECWDSKGNLFYKILTSRGGAVGELWKGGQWVLLSSEHAAYFKCSQKELKQILDKLIELNGEE